MRTLLKLSPLLPLVLLGACQVTKDGNNDSVTVEYNQDVAENGAAAVAGAAKTVASDIGNDVERTADKIDNKVGSVDVNVDVDHNNSATVNTATNKN